MDKGDPLAGLVDIPLPPVVSLWPQTWPSRIAIVVLIAGLLAAAWWFVRAWRANRYRRAALAEIDAIAPTPASLALLIRRTALAAFPRDKVVAPSGADWLAFLDHTYGGTGFSQGPGRVLAAAPYERPVVLSEAKDLLSSPTARDDQRRTVTDFDVPYEPTAQQVLRFAQDDKKLLDLARRWIRTHHA